MNWTTGYFMLSGEFDPDEITQQLGFEPTWVQRIGDPGPSDALGPRRGAEWCLACDGDGVIDASQQTVDVDDQIITLIYKLSAKTKVVAELSSKFDGTFHIHLLLSILHRGFLLTPETLKELANLNIYVDCTYFEVHENAILEPTGANQFRR